MNPKTTLKGYYGQERRDGTYVEATYTTETVDLLSDWVKENKIPQPLDKTKYHSTVLYSRTQLPKVHGAIYDRRIDTSRDGWQCQPTGFKLFDSNGRFGDKTKKALVMLLSAPKIEELFAQLLAAGGTHDYPDYYAHVTLSYKCPLDFDLAKLHVPSFYLQVYQVIAKPLDINEKPTADKTVA